MLQIRAISPDMLDFYWGKIFPQVRDALKHSNDEQDPFHVYHSILDGSYILLVVLEGEKVLAHCTVSKTTLPNKSILNLITSGGSQRESWVKDILKVIETIGKGIGCSHVYICGRKGWAKVLKDYTPTYTIYTKELL